MTLRILPLPAVALTVLMLLSAGCDRSADQPYGPAAPGEAPAPEAPDAAPATGPAAAAPGGGLPLKAQPGERVLAFRVEGMHCTGCAQGVTQKLKGLPGVRQVRVSFPAQAAWVTSPEGEEDVTPSVVEAVEALGYKATRLPDNAPAPATPSAGDS